jgi:hypothetical protein
MKTAIIVVLVTVAGVASAVARRGVSGAQKAAIVHTVGLVGMMI